MGTDNRTKAAIHVAKKQLALSDESYRDLMQRVAGVTSSKDLDEAGARRLMTEFERLGFVNDTKKRRKGHDDRPLARKAWALWISLHNLDEVEHGTEKAFAAFVSRTTHKLLLRFCDPRELNQVVEGLKSWCRRVGVQEDTARGVVKLQWKRLAQHERERLLGPPAAADAFTTIDTFASRVLGADRLDAAGVNRLANDMGAELRRLKLGTRHASQKEGA